jgi:hypothetical protein
MLPYVFLMIERSKLRSAARKARDDACGAASDTSSSSIGESEAREYSREEEEDAAADNDNNDDNNDGVVNNANNASKSPAAHAAHSSHAERPETSQARALVEKPPGSADAEHVKSLKDASKEDLPDLPELHDLHNSQQQQPRIRAASLAPVAAVADRESCPPKTASRHEDGNGVEEDVQILNPGLGVNEAANEAAEGGHVNIKDVKEPGSRAKKRRRSVSCLADHMPTRAPVDMPPPGRMKHYPVMVDFATNTVSQQMPVPKGAEQERAYHNLRKCCTQYLKFCNVAVRICNVPGNAARMEVSLAVPNVILRSLPLLQVCSHNAPFPVASLLKQCARVSVRVRVRVLCSRIGRGPCHGFAECRRVRVHRRRYSETK